MIFAKHPKAHVWWLNNHLMEQVKTFKYLGIVFHAMGNLKFHAYPVSLIVQKTALALQSFYFSKGAQNISRVLKIFLA